MLGMNGQRVHANLRRAVVALRPQGIEQGILQGTRQGRQQGQALVLRRQIERKFGQETAGQLSDLLAEFSGPEDIDKVTDALLECATGEEFIDRVRTG